MYHLIYSKLLFDLMSCIIVLLFKRDNGNLANHLRRETGERPAKPAA